MLGYGWKGCCVAGMTSSYNTILAVATSDFSDDSPLPSYCLVDLPRLYGRRLSVILSLTLLKELTES